MANVTFMFDFLNNARDNFFEIFEKEVVYDDIVDSWFLMDPAWPVFTIVLVYLLFVLIIGPRFMKNREPFNLKGIILIYNITQVFYNGFLLYWFFSTPGGLSYFWNHSCHPKKRELFPLLMLELNKGSWFYFFSKVIDLLDTVFFILKKKNSHVSVLHVYHHAIMIITCWVQLRFYKGTEGLLAGLLNVFIHVIMYSYYFLSAMGPRVQKYLWWKKYLTLMQIVQFIIILTYLCSMFIFQCGFPKTYSLFLVCNVCIFLYLFTMFYKDTYAKNYKVKSS
ncbi:elongation of very long chain fatty acids protein AAEL008004-like [Daktulosphaira vitifoliae]|uniref:elongation of very long chain fatty acids protein AAEL008004-like n=1 Tax=Daktulosphaira vitifoliae TaxID=58002 RepID=UPI0021AAE321|nr:elongation of very long chain fatty acids protein AAEL008004-like [Daktulosphaira vitifoliae]